MFSRINRHRWEALDRADCLVTLARLWVFNWLAGRPIDDASAYSKDSMSTIPDDDDDSVGALTEAEAVEMAALCRSRESKFDEIIAQFAVELGYMPAAMSLRERAMAVAAAENARELWETNARPAASFPEPLQKLLKEHWEIEERILDLEDGAAIRPTESRAPL